jgi:phosphoglycerate dehydrogenase-like enzyme
MKVLLNFHLAEDVRMSVPDFVLERLRSRFPEVEFVGADDRETLAREAAEAEVFYGWRFPEDLLPTAHRLRWIQSASAGIESMQTPAFVEAGVRVTNGAGIAAVAIAEQVIGCILALCRNLHVAIRRQAEARWDRPGVMAGTGTPLREFGGSRLAVLGLGPIGRAVARMGAALGATVRGMRRHPPEVVSAPYEAVVGPDGLDGLLAWGDFVVLAIPHTTETEHVIGARELALMRPDSYLVNVARGAVVDEDALVDALHRGSIAGAALDVFSAEPLPPTSPLWKLPNVIMTPHMAGATPRYLERALDLFVDNLARYREGRRLRNEVDPVAGYPTHTE